MRRHRALPLLAALLLSGCGGDGRPRAERPDPEAALAHDRALLHDLARRLQERPDVVCLSAGLPEAGGLPGALLGDVDVSGTTTALPAAERDALARSVAEQVWRLGLTELQTLDVSLGPAGADADGSSRLGEVLDGPGTFAVVQEERLEQVFGPRPSPAASVPPDPGPQRCP